MMIHWSEADVRDAIAQLAKLKMYAPLVSAEALARTAWTTDDIATVYSAIIGGKGVQPETVKKWCQQGRFAGARSFGGTIGWRVPVESIIMDAYLHATEMIALEDERLELGAPDDEKGGARGA